MGKKHKSAMRFHVPFTATAPPMTSRAVGIVRLTQRRASGTSTDVTIIDSPDNRLLRSGVTVSHRVCEGLGHWVLEAPAWAPRLPSHRSEPVGATAELPLEYAMLVRPIARGAVLGPVAALDIERTEYTMLGPEDAPVAAIVDEQVAVRRGGVTTARYRETTITPTAEFTPQQREFVLSSMLSVSATPVDSFPSLQQRLGPPATGMTDFPQPQPVRRDSTLEELVTAVFARDLHDLVDTLLDLASARPDDVAVLNSQLATVARDVRGFAHALDPQWCRSVQELVSGAPFGSIGDAVPVALRVADTLVGAVHAPRLGDTSHDLAAPLLHRRAQQGVYILADRCRALEESSPDKQWEGALQAAEQLAVSAAVASLLPGKPLTKIVRLLDELSTHLRSCVAPPDEPVALEGLTLEEAFREGARAERRRFTMAHSRARFVAQWPERIAKLRKYQEKAKKKR